MAWNPETYLSFAGERTRPAAELLARVRIEEPRRVVDLGCGPGNSTALLAARWPKAALEGVDSSETMLGKARTSGVKADWHQADIAEWKPAQAPDVIFANAVFQWLPHQDRVLPRLMASLAQGGVLAFQVPVNFEAPSHRLVREVASDVRWREQFSSLREPQRGEAARYYSLLEPHAASLDIWQTEYLQVLKGEDAVYRWVSATSARPFLEALQGEERDAFIARCQQALREAYPMRRSGVTLFPFARLFVVATK